jgi:methionyl-tRNA formyltransferase
MKKSKKLVFFGNERLATAVDTTAPTLRALVKSGYDVSAVVANYTEGVSRTRKRLEIVEVAHAYHIPVLMSEKPADIIQKLQSYGADAAVLVAYGKIIPQKIIDIFPKGIINIHPSLLPEMRGPTPVETAILDGLNQTGVSLISLSSEMDAGPIFAQQKIGLSSQETKAQLASKLLKTGSQLLLSNLPGILEDQIQPQVQDETDASYTKLIKKTDGVMDFGQPAEILERQVRAFAGWPKSTAKIHGQNIIVTKARVAKSQEDGSLVIQAKPGFLEIQELVAPSGRSMSGADFIRGYAVGDG